MSAAGAETHVAERLYYDSPELTFPARVTDIRLVANQRTEAGEREQLWQVALDRTAFYPESGGQPWDTGVLVATARSGAVLEVPVERVEEDETTGEVWHYIRKPLVEGTEVEGRVDAARRTDHMQQHTGQHLLSAVFLSQLGAHTVSFHLGAETSTIDLALPEGMKAITPEQIVAVETEVNHLIFQDRSLCPRWHTREEAEGMLARGDLRKLPERTGPMRIVEMQGVEFNACGGTHVRSTGAIGGLLLRRLEKVKQGWRVEFVCGLRMVRTARRDYDLLSGVAQGLSVGATDVPARVAALLQENKHSAKENKTLLREIAVAEAHRLQSTVPPDTLIEAHYQKKSADFAMALASELRARGRGAVVSFQEDDLGGVAFARMANSALHAGQVMKEVIQHAAAGSRGGGSAELGQIFCDRVAVAEVRQRVTQVAKSELSRQADPNSAARNEASAAE